MTLDDQTGWNRASRRERLDPAALSARTARGMLRDACTDGRVSPEATETGLLLISELVTNAVTHGAGHPVVEVDVAPRRLRVTVTDQGRAVPRIRRGGSPLAERGRGLLLVDTLATRWGTSRRVPTGKSVWFELDHP